MTKAKRKTLTREQILSADDIKTQWVPVPEWGEDAALLVSTWNTRTRDAFDMTMQKLINEGHKDQSIRPLFIAFSVVDPKTLKPLFSVDDIKALEEKCGLPINRLFNVAATLNPMNDAVIEAAAKN